MPLQPDAPARIAVAEDEPDNRKTFVRLLEALGHKVICIAANGEELLEQCQLDNIDLVFVDLDMPVMDGLAAAEQIEKRGIPVILVSGHEDADHVVLEHEPILTWLKKPVTLKALKESINLAMRE
jgi:two-component system, response regulator PdtaR